MKWLIFLLFPMYCSAQYDTIIKRVNVNIYSNYPYNNDQWNNWKPLTQVYDLKYEDGSESAFSVSLTGQTGIASNGSSYISQVARETSYSTVSRELKINGLDDELLYSISLFASRDKSGQQTRFTINGIAKSMATHFNDKYVLFENIKPANGIIIVKIERVNPDYNYLNAFIIEEKTVKIANRFPVLNLRDTTMYFGDQVNNFPIYAYDLDGDSVTYKARKVSTTDTAAYITTGTPMAGPYIQFEKWNYDEVWEVVATDSKGASTNGFFTIHWRYDRKKVIAVVDLGVFGLCGICADGSIKRFEE